MAAKLRLFDNFSKIFSRKVFLFRKLFFLCFSNRCPKMYFPHITWTHSSRPNSGDCCLSQLNFRLFFADFSPKRAFLSKVFSIFASKYRQIVVMRLSPFLVKGRRKRELRLPKQSQTQRSSAEVPVWFLWVKQYSINVVGNIWEPRKFTRYHISKWQDWCLCDSVGTTYQVIWAILGPPDMGK